LTAGIYRITDLCPVFVPKATAQVSDAVDDDTSNAIQSAVSKLATTIASSSSTESNALIRSTATSSGPTSALAKLGVSREAAGVPWEDEKPTWHAPWEMKTVITGGHLGWVRTVTVDPTNSWFATGAADRTIKIWDLAARKLKLTLTGHVAGVRSLVASERHPYLFSAGEDRQVFCWDLESNKAIRHYFGHNAGVYTMALHPELDLLVTGSRDRSVKVWDLRSRAAVFTWHNHTATVHTVAAQATEPQIMSGSADSTIRLWDLVAGKTRTTLTNHSKGVRDLLLHPTENTMLSAGADNIKRWKFPDGNFMNNYEHNAGTIQALAINHENVFVSASDNGKLQFWDYRTAHCFQATETVAQPGSVASEVGIFDLAFDRTGSRLITCEADKTIKIWAEVQDATPTTHPLNWKAKRRKTQW
jgi:pleiotropic regulator 1